MVSRGLVWFRNDLRLEDNPALCAAVKSCDALLFVYVLDDETPGQWRLGGAARWWLHHSLKALSDQLASYGHRLELSMGRADEVITQLCQQQSITHIFWNRCYEPEQVAHDAALKSRLRTQSIQVESFNANLLVEPWEVALSDGGFYKVFTPFWRQTLKQLQVPDLLPIPAQLGQKKSLTLSESLSLDALTLLPTKPDWSGGMRAQWQPGARGAAERFEVFIANGLARYDTHRDRPDTDATSMLSPYLRFGEISIRQLWHRAEELKARGEVSTKPVEKFQAELGWREFSYNLLYHNPELSERAFRPEFNAFPWSENNEGLRAWQRGLTGYPLVDAGMRQLWQTGWMHNRVRMIVGSFLTKNLLIPWQEGERWFWDTLVDADRANNSASWQWVAGCGADAAPYFRIFNPITQSQKFDPDGHYIRRYVPELRNLKAPYIHAPWEALSDVLNAAGISLGETYPMPMMDHSFARDRALSAYERIKKKNRME